MKTITFTNIFDLDFYPPIPAIKNVPEWYKKSSEYVNDEGKKIPEGLGTPHTIKKCMPVFDAMTAGYILFTQVDIEITIQNGDSFFKWPSQEAIAFHTSEQAALHSINNGKAIAKWMNPYSIKTEKGYSSLFINPMHSDNKIFTILPGLVDTDTYDAPVNFPFFLNDPLWTGIIPAGTPMAQVIPIKRDSWKMEKGSLKEIEQQGKTLAKLKTTWFNSYKKNFWNRKEFL